MIAKSGLIFRIVSIILWIGATIGFISDEFLPFLESSVSVVFFINGLILLVLGLWTLRNKIDKLIIGSFVVISVLSTIIINKESFFVWFNGCRDFFGLLFCLPIFRYLFSSSDSKEYKDSFDKQLYIFLVIQVFCIGWQFVKYGAGDHGGGSLGNGNSGTISLLIYIISFYLLSKKWNTDYSYFKNLQNNKQFIFLLLPTFFNETKISFVLLFCYFILLNRLDKTVIFRQLKLIPLLCILLYGLFLLYAKVTNQELDQLTGTEFYSSYLFGGDQEALMELAIRNLDGEFEAESVWVLDLPRFAKFAFVPEALSTTKGGLILGAGLGQFKGGTHADKTNFAIEYEWLLRGSVPTAFYIVIQLGIIGLVWFICYILFVISFSTRTTSYLSVNLKLFLLAETIILLFYLDVFRILTFAMLFVYLAMASGYKNEIEEHERQ